MEAITEEPTVESAPLEEQIPDTRDRTVLLDWVDDGWKQRAHALLDVERSRPADEWDHELLDTLVRAIEGLPAEPSGDGYYGGNYRTDSVIAREQEIIEAEFGAPALAP